MEWSFRIIMVMVLLLVALVVFMALIGSWGQSSSGIFDSLMQFFNSILPGS